VSYNKLDNQINIISSIDTISRKYRIDPSQYNVETQRIIRKCKESNIHLQKMVEMGCIKEIYLPNRFTRAYAGINSTGVPMLGTSSMLNLKLPKSDRIFINKIRNSKKLYIEEGDILVSRSGTVGTSVLCGEAYKGYVGSDHCMRVRISDEFQGYIAAYLQSKYGMALLIKDAHGKVIRELTPENIEQLPVMIFDKHEIKMINDNMIRAKKLYDESRNLLLQVEVELHNKLKDLLPKQKPENHDIISFDSLMLNRIDPHMYNTYSNYIFKEIMKKEYMYLGDVATVWGTGRFKRYYLSSDNPNGVGLYSSSDIIRANLSPSKYISKKLNAKELKSCLIDEDTVLIPCSGTFGGILGHGVLAGKLMSGKAVTQHVLRVKQKTKKLYFYYVSAFLCSENWGYHLISATRFGKDIPEIAPEVLNQIPIPVIHEKEQKFIGDLFKKATILQEEANKLENSAIGEFEKLYEGRLVMK
jgi:restriction endonuclease S subunit